MSADLPTGLGDLLARYPGEAGRLVPPIRQRLRDLPESEDYSRDGLVYALSEFGSAAAASVPELVSLLPDFDVIRALGRISPQAGPAVPSLLPLLADPDPRTAVAAGLALWRIQRDAPAVLPVLAAHLDGDRGWAALDAIAEIGGEAAALVPRLLDALERPDWTSKLAAATAVWRVTGQAGPVLPVFLAAWTEWPDDRAKIARLATEIGPPAEALAPLLRVELASPRRHNPAGGWGSDLVAADEDLLNTCAAALAAVTVASPS